MDKLIITNKSAINAKYGIQSEIVLAKILKLVEIELAKGMSTMLVYLDEIDKIGLPKVTNKDDCKQNKDAIDALFNHYKPEAVVLLGSDDIVPFQRLNDPLPSATMPEPVYSDLPYACDTPYSMEISSYILPVRRVTRLPDVNGPLTQYGLEAFIKTLYYAGSWASSNYNLYEDWWNVCTTQRTVAMYATRDYFKKHGVNFNIFQSPPYGPKWDEGIYAKMVHHHILHGCKGRNILYGESNTNPTTYPEAVKGELLYEKVRQGMVLLERACYGAQLYNPRSLENMPLANIYLSSGAASMIGSTVTTYSRSTDMHYSDYIVSMFMEEILNGNDISSALLAARHNLRLKFSTEINNPVFQKIFAEYVVYGNSDVRPVCKNTGGSNDMGNGEKFKRLRELEKVSKQQGYAVLNKEAKPPEQIKQYIMEFLYSKGVEIDPSNPPEINCYDINGGKEFLRELSTSGKTICQYSVIVEKSQFESTVYIFTEENGGITEISEHVSN